MKIAVTLFLAFTLGHIAHCQKIIFPNEQCKILCTYRLTFQPDSIDSTVHRSESMRLAIGKSISAFESIGNYLSDSLYATVADTPPNGDAVQTFMDKRQNLPSSRFRYTIYKNRTLGILYYYDKIDGKSYYYSQNSITSNWHIMAEKKSIAGYVCQKATTVLAGRTFEAWFTKEVPLSDGPYKFSGLPGLIIKVSDTRQQYMFELTSLKQIKYPALIALPAHAAVLTTKVNIQRAQRDYYANLQHMVATKTSTTTTSKPENAQEMRNRLQKKFNNALEIR